MAAKRPARYALSPRASTWGLPSLRSSCVLNGVENPQDKSRPQFRIGLRNKRLPHIILGIMETASIVASIVSIILGLLAIALSLFFYSQSKNTEKEVEKALEGVKSQTDALQRLAGRQMDRLIRGVTEPRPVEDSLVQVMLTAITQMPASIVSQLQGASAGATNQALINEAITCYIATYYYAGIANVALQSFLRPLGEIEPDDPTKRLIDQTSTDFRYMEGLLNRVDSSELAANRLNHLYTEAATQWKPYVMDSTMVYKLRDAART